MKFTAAEYKKWLEQTIRTINKSSAQINYLVGAIAHAEENIPILEKQLEHYTKMLPEWKKKLKQEQVTLVANKKRLVVNQKKFELANKIEATKRKLQTIEIDIQKSK